MLKSVLVEIKKYDMHSSYSSFNTYLLSVSVIISYFNGNQKSFTQST